MNFYSKRALPASLLSICTLLGTQAAFAESKMNVDTKGGLSVFDIQDEDYWFKLGGRLNFDYASFHSGSLSGYPSGANLRRAKVTLKGGVGSQWVYKVDLDHGSNGTAEFGEAFVAYDGFENIWIAVGQVGSPFSLDNWMSSNESFFMENALPVQAFSPSNGLGVYAEGTWTDFTWAASMIAPKDGVEQIGDASPAIVGLNAPAGAAGRGAPGSDPLGFSGRLTYAPIHTSDRVYHFGTSFNYQDVKDLANLTNFSTRPEIRGRNTPSFGTGVPSDSVKDYWVLGFEAAGKWGPVVVLGEYFAAHMNRFSNVAVGDARFPGGDLAYNGYYVAASYVVTGETKDYDFASATFGRVRPSSKSGAVELLARHSYVDLQDRGFGLGHERDTTLGATWWVNDYLRFMMNYTHARLPIHSTVNIVGARAQVNW